jgi:hypothetical protein
MHTTHGHALFSHLFCHFMLLLDTANKARVERVRQGPRGWQGI